jgi:hypothetical protein
LLDLLRAPASRFHRVFQNVLTALRAERRSPYSRTVRALGKTAIWPSSGIGSGKERHEPSEEKTMADKKEMSEDRHIFLV